MNKIDIQVDFNNKYINNVTTEASYSGIYVVYDYKRINGKDTWYLLDIGQADNIYQRHLTHERKSLWEIFAKIHECTLNIYTAKIREKYVNKNLLSRRNEVYNYSGGFSFSYRNGKKFGNLA